LLNNDAGRLPAEFEELGNILDESLEDVRRSIFDLRPLLLDEEGLFAAIEQFTTSLGEQYDVKIHIQLEGDEKSLPSDIAHAAFRIIQELTHNAMKHAQAANLYITLSIGRDLVSLEVRDDGLGFDTSKIAALTQSEHYGLDHLQRRVALLKGLVVIKSADQQGTHIRISLPL
jgi:two-component system sensor histidine kinase DegS